MHFQNGNGKNEVQLLFSLFWKQFLLYFKNNKNEFINFCFSFYPTLTFPLLHNASFIVVGLPLCCLILIVRHSPSVIVCYSSSRKMLSLSLSNPFLFIIVIVTVISSLSLSKIWIYFDVNPLPPPRSSRALVTCLCCVSCSIFFVSVLGVWIWIFCGKF